MVGSRALSVSKEEGVCGLPRSAYNLSLNRPPLKIEKRRGVRMIYASASLKMLVLDESGETVLEARTFITHTLSRCSMRYGLDSLAL